MFVEPLTSQPERFHALTEVRLFGDGARFEVESVWTYSGRWVFKFRGIDTISAAEPLRGAEIRLPASERRPLDDGEYFLSDLVGCEVTDREGRLVGCVTGFQETGGAGLLELEDGLLIPFARTICIDIDPAKKRIVVDLPEGLKELNR